MKQDPKSANEGVGSLLLLMSRRVNLLHVKYQLILGFACRRTGKKNDTRPKITPLSDVRAHKPFASRIPAYFGVCVPTHRTRE